MEYKRLTKRIDTVVVYPYGEYEDTTTAEMTTGDIRAVMQRLAELEDKIENGTLIFKKKPKKKYYAIVGYRNCYGKFDWHIHYVPIEYEKEHNQVALNIDGRLFVTKKDLLFNTQAKAEQRLKELQNEST